MFFDVEGCRSAGGNTKGRSALLKEIREGKRKAKQKPPRVLRRTAFFVLLRHYYHGFQSWQQYF
jgi:hypothetical protein